MRSYYSRVTTILSALSSPDFLAGSFLVGLGILIFVLIRPKEYATEGEFWLALIQPRSKANRAERVDSAEPGKNPPASDIKPQANRSVGLSGN